MSLLSYIANPSNNFSRTERLVLTNWYQQFIGDPALQLIQRNMDRECKRNDVQHMILIDYLRELSWCYRPNQPSPTDFMQTAYGAAPSRYLLPGQPLSVSNERLVRCMRLDHFVKYNLKNAALPLTYDMQGAISALTSHIINGFSMIGSTLGQRGYPVWVSPEVDIDPGKSADDVRDLLGLEHIQFGHLVELSYPQHVLQLASSDLRAPTILDAIAKGAENWVFAKRGTPGGPEWGHTVNLSSCSVGAREAVHSAFHITSPIAQHIKLRYGGVIGRSPSTVDYQQLMRNI